MKYTIQYSKGGGNGATIEKQFCNKFVPMKLKIMNCYDDFKSENLL